MKKLKLLGSLTLVLAVFIPSFAFASVFTSDLSYGVTTSKVSDLQQFLKDEGLYSGPITATFGPLTRSALIAFQRQENITPAAGYFGSITRADANAIFDSHPEWTTTVSNSGSYSNVNGNTIQRPAYSPQTPAGATAQCRDGAYSYSLHHSGSCSGHGGVSAWLK